MTISEKAAYLKGLTDGLGFDADSKEGKLWNVLNDLLGDMAHEIEDLEDSNNDMAEIIDDISEDLSYLEEITCDLDTPSCPDDDDFDCDGDCSSCQGGCIYDEDDEDPELVYDGDEYELTCPTCGEEFSVTEDELRDLILCPNCGEELEAEFDDDDGEDE